MWTLGTSGFNLYCLHEAAPGSEHTGYYIISFDFVYVGNPHGEISFHHHKCLVWLFGNFNFPLFLFLVRNLLALAAAVSVILALALLVTSVMLLDALRKEQEHAFRGWLWSMGIFTVWRLLAFVYCNIVNDLIFAYNIVMFIAWFVFNIINVFAFVCIWSLYLELNDLTKIQDLAKLKVNLQAHFL